MVMTDDLAPGRVSKLGFTESKDGRSVAQPLTARRERKEW